MTDRNRKILEDYKNGHTLEELAKSLKVTRSRIQQIVSKEMEKDIVERLNITYRLSPQDKEMLKAATHEEIRQVAINRDNKRHQEQRESLIEKIKNDPLLRDTSNFPTVSSYAKALKITVTELKKYLPNTVESINHQKKTKWSRQYDKCLTCGTMSIPHKNKGYCEKCYPKSTYFKQMVRASFLRHIDARKKKMREYMEEYKTRPEVIERYRRQNDELNFGGNRQKALGRDCFTCTSCGMTQEKSYKKYGRDLYVEHKEGKSNELDNLLTVCQGCHNEKIIQIAREKGNETLFQKYMRLYNREN